MLIPILSENKESDSKEVLLQKLYEVYDPLLFWVAARYFPESPEEREDAVQKAWLKVLQHLGKAREIPDDRIPFWLVCIVKNEAIAILRRQRKHLPLEDGQFWRVVLPNKSMKTGGNRIKTKVRRYLHDASAFGFFQISSPKITVKNPNSLPTWTM